MPEKAIFAPLFQFTGCPAAATSTLTGR